MRKVGVLVLACVAGWALSLSAVVVSTAPSAGAASAVNDKQSQLEQWFSQYDQIRREAQMSDAERERSRQLMAQGMAANLFQTRDAARDKQEANALIKRMIDRYAKASAQIASLPTLGSTKKLHQGYQAYFRSAHDLFSDYLKVQNNLLATDAAGTPLLGQMQQRKLELENLDLANKDLDSKLRAKFGIAPYRY